LKLHACGEADRKFNGWAADKYGPKIVMQVSIVALTGFIFIMVFANSLGMLVAGQVLCGIPWGVFQTLTTAYAAEVSQNRRNRKIAKKSENTNFRSALSSYEVISLHTSISAGVWVSSCHPVSSKLAYPSPPTGHGESPLSSSGFGSLLFSLLSGSLLLLHGGLFVRADSKKPSRLSGD